MSCRYCQGKCCRDDLNYKVKHMSAEFYTHDCEHCDDGTERNEWLFTWKGMRMTTLRAELLQNMNLALEREYLLFLDYDRNPRLITIQVHQHEFNSSDGYYGPYHCAVRASLLDVPLYLGV